MTNTNQQYQKIIKGCKDLFLKKASDYGVSWSILRMPSVTDQIYIKAERIKSLQEKKVSRVGEGTDGEFIGIINYCVIALMLWKAKENKTSISDSLETLSTHYDEMIEWAYDTMLKKNHDYGEAWRKMRISSMTDLILMKIFRLKKIEDNQGETIVSEGADANYIDMLNYAVFCLILTEENSVLNDLTNRKE